jgi:membrane-associated phospholipid phosphatase
MQGHAYAAGTLRPRRLPARARPGDPKVALAVAGLCVLAMAAVWSLAELVPAIQFKDAVALHDFTRLNRPAIDGIGNLLIKVLRPELFILWGVALVAACLARGRPRVALAVVAVMSLAPLTSELLKPLLAHPHVRIAGLEINPASWPSGHSTAALALALCVVLVAPARLRPVLSILAGAFALAVGIFLLVFAWHMPSDVLGGYLVASMWMALAVAGLRAAERRWPSARPPA